MENKDYVLVNQRPIIDLLIEGEVFQYLSGSDIQSLGKKFGVTDVGGSVGACWKRFLVSCMLKE
ncbi:hypothetical protein [Liquorilactobacillus sucicola]|uniref:hypothetical protein n=1 Tax=Liquorilactobacillus sucicola TaxID=519050 RepID=UPI0005593FC4|nr:hypothetical protein [Liquorilactobacillus sucicola]